ncbi:MAG: hypothetical protein U0736_15810 [Gemmataceae bacterium]
MRRPVRTWLVVWLALGLLGWAVCLASGAAATLPDAVGLFVGSLVLAALPVVLLAFVALVASRYGTLRRRFTAPAVLLGFTAINLSLALVAGCAATLDWPGLWRLGIGLLLSLGLAAPVLSGGVRDRVRLPAELVAPLAWVAVSFMLWVLAVADGTRGLRLARGQQAVDLTPADVPEHATAVGFAFSAGHGRGDLAGLARNVKTRSTDSWYAVPFVDEGWTPDRPVTVWAVCYGTIDEKVTAGRFRAGFLHDPHDDSINYLVKARDDAVARHGLRSHPQAVFLDMGESLTALTHRHLAFLLVGLMAPNLIWLIGVLLPRDPPA